MSEHEARGRAVYDHDNEESRPPGRRRRQVADWGVGEEIFDHMPGGRFERRPHQEIPRGDAADGRRTIVIETGDDELPAATPEPAADEFASREEALRAREAHEQLWAGDEPFADERRATDVWAAGDEPFAQERRTTDEWAAGDAPSAEDRRAAADAFASAWGAEQIATAADRSGAEESTPTDGIVRGGQAGRRTVKIGGRPAEFYGPPARARQRPPRAMHERLGPRPDRVAMWAFALGLLLILIAVATAKAAVPV
jgi:hypothetical protein